MLLSIPLHKQKTDVQKTKQHDMLCFSTSAFTFYTVLLLYFIQQTLQNFTNPSFRCFNSAHLNAGQGFIQFFGNWSHFAHAAGKANFFAVIYHFAYRRNNSGSSAQTAFGKSPRLSILLSPAAKPCATAWQRWKLTICMEHFS